MIAQENLPKKCNIDDFGVILNNRCFSYDMQCRALALCAN